MTGKEKTPKRRANVPPDVATGDRAPSLAAPGTAEDPFGAVLAVMQSAGLIPATVQADRATRSGG